VEAERYISGGAGGNLVGGSEVRISGEAESKGGEREAMGGRNGRVKTGEGQGRKNLSKSRGRLCSVGGRVDLLNNTRAGGEKRGHYLVWSANSSRNIKKAVCLLYENQTGDRLIKKRLGNLKERGVKKKKKISLRKKERNKGEERKKEKEER